QVQGNQGSALSPYPSRFHLIVADQDLMGQFERSKLPGVPVIACLYVKKIQEYVQVLAVIRVRAGGVVIQILVVIFHQDFQDALQKANDVQASGLRSLSLD